jgi:hypothetical protein
LTADKIADSGFSDRVAVTAADFFEYTFPEGVDCFFFIHQLVICPVEVISALLTHAYYDRLNDRMIVILNSMANDEEDGPLAAALDTAYFLTLPTSGGMIYPWIEYERCLKAAGFCSIERVRLGLWTPQGAIVAKKLAK